MMRSAQVREKEIHQRIRFYRKRYEERALLQLSVLNLCLLVGIGILGNAMQIRGISSVTSGYSAVMLRNEAGAYVLVGIAAFVVGVVLTVCCIRIQQKREKMKEECEK